MRLVGRAGRVLGIEFALPVVIFAGWWIASAGSTSLFFPSLGSIFESLGRDFLFDHVISDLFPSLQNWLVAMVIAIVFGVGVGMLLGLSMVIREIVRPVVDGLRSTPAVVLLPVAVALFGIGPPMSVPIIAFAATWPILINSMAAAQAIDPAVHDMRHVYGIRGPRALFKVMLPAASPQILLGIRQGLAVGLTILILSEMVGATNGIGYFILQTERNFLIPEMWAGMLVLAITGYLINLAFRGVEHLLLGWHYQESARKAEL